MPRIHSSLLGLLFLFSALLAQGCPDADDDDTSADDDDVVADDDDAVDDDDSTVDDDDASADDDDSGDDDDDVVDDDDSGDDDDASADDDDSASSSLEVNSLAAHLDLFIANNLSATLSYGPLAVLEVVDASSDLGALADLVASDWTIIQAGVVDETVLPNDAWVTFTGTGQAQFETDTVAPALVDGAVVVQVDWDLDGLPATNYAVVQPGGGAPDEADAFLVAAVDHFRVLDGSRDALDVELLDGFGGLVTSAAASLLCANDLCESSLVALELGAGCDVLADESTTCALDGSGCVAEVAIVAYCGNPTFTYDPTTLRYVQDAGTFGAAHLDISSLLTEPCACLSTEDLDADGFTPADGDCDDNDDAIFPGATEICDAVDYNCDGVLDDGFDVDGDGATTCGPDGDLTAVDDNDCDDGDIDRFPGATELCDGIDNDCDGALPLVEQDLDGDGFMACENDCDDADDDINPAAEELCADSVENDCDPLTPDVFDGDADGDYCNVDCDDADPALGPSQPETTCDATDNDCDALTLDDPDGDSDGLSLCDGDCDDADPSNFGGNVEVCDFADNDCDGVSDNGLPQNDYFPDLDGDGFGTAGAVLADSEADFSGNQGEAGWSYGSYPAFQPAAFSPLPSFFDPTWIGTETFDTPYLHALGGHPGADSQDWAVRRWTASVGGTFDIVAVYQDSSATCGDGSHVRVLHNSAQIFEALNIPSATQGVLQQAVTVESGDTLDFAIDPIVDTGCDATVFAVSITSNPVSNCAAPSSQYVADDTDCDDSDAATNPGAIEVCYDGFDRDCNGVVDEPCNTAPSITSLTITPDPATVANTLLCAATTDDLDGEPVTVTYSWTVGNGGPTAGSTLSSGFAKGDLVECTAVPNDGQLVGAPSSGSITIDNSAPTITSIAIDPPSPGAGDTIICDADAVDLDVADSLSWSYSWTVGGSPAADTDGDDTLSDTVTEGQTLVCTATVSDGTIADDATDSAQDTVANTPPTVTGVTITPPGPVVADTLSCSATTGDVDTGDTVTVSYSWTNTSDNDAVIGTSATVSGGFSATDVVRCTVAADDGTVTTTDSATVAVGAAAGDVVINEVLYDVEAVPEADGEWIEVYNPTATAIDLIGWILADGNSADTIDTNVIIPAAGYAVLCRNAAFADNGGVTCRYEWSALQLSNVGESITLTDHLGVPVDSFTYDGTFPAPVGASISLDPSLQNAADNNVGANWCAASTPFGDGDFGTPGGVNDSCNSSPVISSVAISPPQSPTEPNVGSAITCLAVATDADITDTVTISYAWTVGGAPSADTDGDGTLTDTFARDEAVVCTATASDGTPAHDVSDSDSVIIRNTPPVIGTVDVLPVGATELDPLTCTPDGTTDADGDTAFTYTYTWDNGGPLASETNSTLATGNYAVGDQVFCAATPSDGITVGSSVVSQPITIQSSAPVEVTFNYTGSVQQYTVPLGVFSIDVDASGAAGGVGPGSATPGLGGTVVATLPVTPGDVLNVYVGGVGQNDSNSSSDMAGGFNGGGIAYDEGQYGFYGGGSGGGASDIRLNGTALGNRVLVAGGGGGGGADGCTAGPLAGGHGGGLTGGAGNAGSGCSCNPSGQGGTQSEGGAKGNWGCSCNATDGGQGNGGNSNSSSCGGPQGGAGGGGGYYGGGGGGLGAGGGGSSFTTPSATGVQHTQGVFSGNGQVTISM